MSQAAAIFTTKAICLADIKRKADWLRMDSEDLRRYVSELVALPNYDTESEDAVMLAMKELNDATERVGKAWAYLQTKREIANSTEGTA